MSIDKGASKIFNDPVHGHIELPPLCIKIIDTPQFQRLRYIKQLSFCSYVYPGGIHSRFEHSLGTCFLAGEQVKSLQRQDPDLGITDKDILCVEIAALCHDLGHGPFSHLWEQFVNRVTPDAKWKHEDSSVKMLTYLIEENNLRDAFRESFDGQHEEYLKFIKLQINGSAENRQRKPWKLPKEEQDRSFLYEVVSNKETGIDVDKWDYIARDCHHIGFKHNFSYDRIIKFSRVSNSDDGKKRICFREKEQLNLLNMYLSRFMLHSRVYHHKTTKIIDRMVVDALVEANDHIVYKNGDKSLKMCDATLDLKFFSTMTDSIFEEIIYSNKEELKRARGILERIHARDLYKYVGEKRLNDDQNADGKNKKRRDLESLKKEVIQNIPENVKVSKDDVVCVAKSAGFGMKGKNPMHNAYFFQKSTPEFAKRMEQEKMSKFVPKFQDCEEESILLFCSSNDKDVLSGVKVGFDHVCE